MLRSRLFGFLFAIHLNLNFMYANNTSIVSFVVIDSFPSVLLDSVHIRLGDYVDVSLSPFSSTLLFNPVDGVLLHSGLKAKFNGKKPVSFHFEPRYSFQRKVLYAVGEIAAFVVNDGLNSTQFIFSAGNFLTQVNQPFIKNEQIISLLNLVNGINPLLFVKKEHLKVAIKQTFSTDVVLQVSSTFADRTYLENHHFQRLDFRRNEPLGPFKLRDKSFVNSFSLVFNSLLNITYKKGITGFLKSESDFDYLELAFSQSFKVKDVGKIDVNVVSGKFIHQGFVHFNDFYHFPTGRTLKNSHPIVSTFRLLPYYEFSTKNYFHRIHFQYQMSNFLLSQLSLLKRSNILENIFINIAYTDRLQPFLEFGYAVDNILRNVRLEIVSGRFDGKWLGPRIILGPTSF